MQGCNKKEDSNDGEIRHLPVGLSARNMKDIFCDFSNGEHIGFLPTLPSSSLQILSQFFSAPSVVRGNGHISEGHMDITYDVNTEAKSWCKRLLWLAQNCVDARYFLFGASSDGTA